MMLRMFARHIYRLCAAVCVVCFVVGCDGFTRVDGFVRDAEGKAISSAKVELSCGDRNREILSGPVGEFKIGMTHAPFRVELVLQVTKGGYKPVSKRFSSGEMVKQIDVTLEPVTSPRESSFKDLEATPK